MRMIWLFWGVYFLYLLPSFAQDLTQERIWKISDRKKSIFLDSGVFHKNTNIQSANIVGLRSSNPKGRGYERIVVDFDSKTIPKTYGHIKPKDKLSIDFFNTSIVASPPQLRNSKYFKSINFINVDTKTVTMEIALKGKRSFDIFYLNKPSRLVIDIR